jgi:hypothetical protein
MQLDACDTHPPNQFFASFIGTRVAAFLTVGFTLKAIWLAMLVMATYPVAIGAHVALE